MRMIPDLQWSIAHLMVTAQNHQTLSQSILELPSENQQIQLKLITIPLKHFIMKKETEKKT